MEIRDCSMGAPFLIVRYSTRGDAETSIGTSHLDFFVNLMESESTRAPFLLSDIQRHSLQKPQSG